MWEEPGGGGAKPSFVLRGDIREGLPWVTRQPHSAQDSWGEAQHKQLREGTVARWGAVGDRQGTVVFIMKLRELRGSLNCFYCTN